MCRRRMTSLERKRKQQRTLSLLLVLLALAPRMLYVSVHLAQEEHLGPGAYPLSHASASGDHDDDHLPHPALDHVNEPIARRTPLLTSVDLPALPEGWSPLAPALLSTATRPAAPRPPKLRPRLTHRSRGPPAAA